MAGLADNHRELESLLPFYVNGTLTSEERARVDAALREDAMLRDQARTLEELRTTMHDTDYGQSPGEFGLARLMRDIDRTEAASKSVGTARRHALLPWGLAVAASAALLAVSLGWVGTDQTAPYLQASGDAESSYLTVAFQPDASQSDVSNLLLEQGLVIVDGPSAIGLYRLAPGEGSDVATLAADLRARSDLIESVDLP
jgi:anti-sigma-K factor RskA